MKNFCVRTITLMAIILGMGNLYAKDVISEDPDVGTYVQVKLYQTGHGKMEVGFKECYKGLPEKHCRQLGPEKSYSFQEITHYKNKAIALLIGSAALDLAISWGAGAALEGVAVKAVYEALAYDVAEHGTLLLSAGLAGKAVGAATATLEIGFYPYKKYKQVRALSDAVITDQQVKKTDIREFIRTLEGILNDL